MQAQKKKLICKAEDSVVYVFFSNRIIPVCKMFDPTLLDPTFNTTLGVTEWRTVGTPAILTLTLDFGEKLQ